MLWEELQAKKQRNSELRLEEYWKLQLRRKNEINT